MTITDQSLIVCIEFTNDSTFICYLHKGICRSAWKVKFKLVTNCYGT